ncbi:Gfo/Idh/MocA family protein [Rhizobium leguminosarum]|uniref:Gfo/Idh/MocA family protein n=1 Tax=Rhizobium leguminosarum TaxID=384 RepID=UPI001031BD7F|nr:Gfo/Idh/MocA family oxidoreductase [Rhizobium leguminosarum]TAV90177.1 Gfo/Idh/MocA family oxidoreductase [Rhizobium leguminosarum]TAV94784.1 Gfo/Idh/MocA family oxidoreductase [Rhizobium leguminosarum]TAW35861.1 Gfo/Idh/MocA family oxidoreductase [Rhizobium leguminosarum]TAX30669.1 Gfo/Idh/MocA family oxidoreductase [Rhizobium leguminosarum]TAY33482.1 Gfo/Idh/MocA family oxidoreductase [Rhizobium leguminosarum]
MTVLRVGIVGCGEVTQIIHLPALRQLPGQFAVTALCDVSSTVLEGVAADLPDAAIYSDYRQLVVDTNVDVVLVANPHAYHTNVALAALEAGKDVFIEKPMSMTFSEADALAAAECRSGKTVQVGYMRRYAGAFVEAVERIKNDRENIRFARVQDFIGQNRIIIDDTSRVVRGSDIPEDAISEHSRLSEERLFEAIGTNDPILSRAYGLLLGLSSHDISAMRELLGMPQRVLHAAVRQGGLYITATFDYGHFVCEFVTGIDQIARFDTYLEVYGEKSVTRIDYDTPYVRNVPARLSVTEASGTAGVRQIVSFPSRLDSFVVEWRAFHGHLTTGSKPKTTIADARQDLEVFAEIMDYLKERQTAEITNVAS